MSETRNLLDQIEVASPCTQDWSKMTGDEKRRFCGECRLHVHDLSAMTRDEGEALLRGADDRVCVRFYRRPDGRVLTKDCVTVRDRIRRRARRLRVAAAALFAFVAPFLGGCSAETPSPHVVNPGTGHGDGAVQPPEELPIMGDVLVPTLEPLDDTPDTELEPLMGEVHVEPREMIGRVALPPDPPEKSKQPE